MANQNRLKAKIKKSPTLGLRVELTMERRDAYGSLRERSTFTLPLRTLERALRDATIEAPWKELLK